MSELSEVRRYWPRAKWYKSGNYSAVPNWRKWYACMFRCDGEWDISVGEVDGGTRYHHAPTIASAMRAAGFGVRPLGKFKSREPNSRCVMLTRGNGQSILALKYWRTQLATRQRPRKGVRLGKRKLGGQE